MTTGYFFDAYALVRFRWGAPSYAPFAQEPVITERTHLYEFARFVLVAEGARAVVPAILSLRANRLDPTDHDLLAAAKLRLGHPRLSGADALGYVLAQREGLRFLTGDSAFRKLPGVEFVP